MKVKFLYSLLAATMLFFQIHAQQTAQITSNGVGYLQYLPLDYNSNSNKYPVIISLHGIKEKGTTATDPATVLAGVQIVANVGLAKYIKYGQHYPAIVISPQLKSNYGSWPADYVVQVLNYVKTKLRVDENRVSITGLSLGGGGVINTIAAYPQLFSAAAPMCPANNNISRACAMAAENLPVWLFHGDADAVVHYNVSVNQVNAINACSPKCTPQAKLTIYPGVGHVCWDIAYKQTNVIDWMLSFTNGTTSTTPVTNAAPVANAGADLSRTLPSNSAVLNGSGSDSDGTVSSYFWQQIGGPSSAALSNQYSASLTASNLIAGTYTFQLKVTDNAGASATDNVSVIVNAATSTNTAPTVSAGADKTLTLPSNTVTLYGSASDADGIASYNWTKKSGGAAIMNGTTSPNLALSGLAAGSYVFTFTAADSKGADTSDDVIVTVNSTTTVTNPLPYVTAGPDKALTLPSNSVKLYGSGWDADGIASYTWTKKSGSSAVLTAAGTQTLALSGLAAGTYIFTLTARDNKGAASTDDVIVIVNGSSATVTPAPSPSPTGTNALPVANAGGDKLVGLPSSGLSIYGSGYDPDGTITSYLWTKISGPSCSMLDADRATVRVSSLMSGNYTFRLTVTDNMGATKTDDVILYVSAAPVVSAGADRTVSGSSITMAATASDPDGSIVQTTWTKHSGPAISSMANASTSTVTVNGLVAGTYVFKFGAKDNQGLWSYDYVTVVVSGSTASILDTGSTIETLLASSTVVASR